MHCPRETRTIVERERERSSYPYLRPRLPQPWMKQRSLLLVRKPSQRLLLQHHQVILPKETRKPRRNAKPHLFFRLHRQNHTRTRRARKVGKRADHHRLLTRRRSFAITSSTKVGAIKAISASTVIPRKSTMQKRKKRKQRFVEREREGKLFICWTKEEDILAMAEGDLYSWEQV